MSKQPLDYRGGTRDEDARPQVRWQTVIACTLLGMGVVCGIVATAWAERRTEFVSAAISLGVTGVVIYFPFVRT